LARRVYQLAKELGVKSTAIVAKCQAEGLDVKNHMATLSAGLEATICEWFSEGEHQTAIETTQRVDLKKARTPKKKKRIVKSKKKAKAATEEIAVGAEAAEAVAVAAEPEETVAEESTAAIVKLPAKRRKAPKRKSPKQIAADKDQVSTQQEEVEEEAIEAVPRSKRVKAGAKVRKKKTASKKSEKRKSRILRVVSLDSAETEAASPEPIEHVPQPAKLQGPKVVRVERPDVVRKPPPSRAARRAKPEEEIPKDSTPEVTTSRSGRKGRRRSVVAGDETEGLKGGKPRTSRRRGRRGYDYGTLPRGPHQWGDLDLQERQERLEQASGGKLLGRARRLAWDEQSTTATKAIEPHKIEKAVVKEPITIKELSGAIGVRANDIMSKLMETGVMAAINQVIDSETAIMVSLEFGVDLRVEEKRLLLDGLREQFDKELSDSELQLRPPVVAFLGHVDHGKTSLLDRIRKSSVVSGEAGGITQHIGSYLYDDGKRRVAFLDTPGHKAFTEMRSRGANMTDIVVLVVAADDGVMPQTEEAINHARAAGVPIMVALNKIDLPNADVNRALGQLSEKGLVPAQWGGEVEVVQTSATTGEGIDDLVEHLDYVAELHQLKSKPDGHATGWVVESEMNTSKGVVARLLVKSGTLKSGDVIVSGSSHGRVRTMMDAAGKELKEASPAMPVEISGLDGVPVAGERFYVVDNITQAKEIADEQRSRMREKTLLRRRLVTLDNLFSEIAAGELKELNVIVKADVQGSVDVLEHSLKELNTSEVAVRVLHSAVGGISESDVLLAEASNAIIIGFQVRADERGRALAEAKGVDIRLYRVIYQITDDIRKALEGMLTPEIEEKQLGRVEVRQIFRISRVGVVAGSLVTEGVIQRSAKVRLIRDNIVIRDDMELESLRRVKDDVSEVRAGLECGVKLAGFDDVKVGDVVEAYELVEVSRTLESVP